MPVDRRADPDMLRAEPDSNAICGDRRASRSRTVQGAALGAEARKGMATSSFRVWSCQHRKASRPCGARRGGKARRSSPGIVEEHDAEVAIDTSAGHGEVGKL